MAFKNFWRGSVLSVLIFALPAAADCVNASDQGVFISQVQMAGNKASDDFVELFNPTANPFNLNGYRLVARMATSTADISIKSWTADALVPAYGYFLWANSGFAGIAAAPDATTSASITDSMFGVGLAQKSSGLIIDGIAWGSDANNGLRVVLSKVPDAGQSLRRENLFSATSTFAMADGMPHNSQSAAITSPQTQQDSTTTIDQEQEAASAPVGEATGSSYSLFIKISEIVANPAGEDDGHEAVELQNTGPEAVNIGGWSLVDSSDKSTPYILTDATMSPDSFLAITIPSGYFSLNNSGGDIVNLYYPDHTLADSAVYSGSATEGYGYQNVNGVWMWGPATLGTANAAPPPSGGSSGSSFSSAPPAKIATVASYNAIPLSISEFLPNPLGDDAGKEWVELYNAGDSPVNLNGWILDDGAGSSSPGTTAYAIGSGQSVPAKGYAAVILPAGKFSLSNTRGGARLFRPDKGLAQVVAYSEPPEGQSYAADTSGQWSYTVPTPGAVNEFGVPFAEVFISQLLPNPGQADDQYVKLYNASSGPINLKDFRLLVGTKEKTFDDATIAPQSYYEIYEDDLPAKLRKSGHTVKLLDQWGRELSGVMYGAAAAGEAYAWDGQGYGWTGSSTAGQLNGLVLAASTVAESASAALKAAPPALPSSNSSQISAMVRKDRDLEAKVAVLTQELEALKSKAALPVGGVSDEASAVLSAVPPDAWTAENNQASWISSLALVFSALALLVILIKTFFFSGVKTD